MNKVGKVRNFSDYVLYMTRILYGRLCMIMYGLFFRGKM